MTFITLQQEMDAQMHRPWPMHIATDGSVGQQDVHKGDPARLLGFQNDVEVQHVDILNEEFQANPEIAVGKFPVYVESNGNMFVDIRKVVSAKAVEGDFALIAN